MTYSNMQNALNQYNKVGAQSGVIDASPHRLVQMLMEGALDKILTAKGYLQRREIAEKGRHISWAISIINGLSASLDQEQGGEIAANLAALYEYMCKRLLDANINDSAETLDEVAELMRQIKAGWDAIPEVLEATQGRDPASMSKAIAK